MAIGSDLREAREQRGITLRDISERTKIRQAVLRAIENDDFQGLPGSVIMRGFLKLYAREVGLDPDDVGRRYTAQIEAAAVDDQAAAQGLASSTARTESYRRLAKVAAGAIAVLAVLAAGYRFCGGTSEPRSVTAAVPQTASEGTTAAPKPPPANPSSPASAATSQPQTTAPVAPPEAAGAAGNASTEGLRVDLQATDATWIAATADGQQVAYRVLGAGERLQMRVTKEAVLRIGIPTNVTVAINDRPLKPFGRPGTPTTLRITPANYRELLVQ